MNTRVMSGHRDTAPIRCRVHSFLLVEVVIASVLLAVVFAGVFVSVNQSLFAVRSAMDHYLAVNLAQNRLEKMTRVPVADLWDFVEWDVLIDSDGQPDLNGVFKRTVNLSTHSHGVVEAVVRIDIRNRVTGSFDGQAQELAMLLTDIPEKI